MSEGKIYGAISSILNEIDAIGKDKKNESQGFWFRSIDQVYAAIHPLLAKYRVFPTCKVLGQTREEKTTKNGGLMAYTLLTLEYTFWADDGSSVSTQVVGEGMDSGDKSSNKSLSSGYKYALFQMLCIPAVAVDPDYETHELQPNREPRFQTPPPSQRPQSQPQQQQSPQQNQHQPQNAQQPQGDKPKFVNYVCRQCGEEKVGQSKFPDKATGKFGGFCFACKKQYTPGEFEEIKAGGQQQQSPQQYSRQHQQPAAQPSSQSEQPVYHQEDHGPRGEGVPF